MMYSKDSDSSISLLPLLPMCLFEQTGMEDAVDSAAGPSDTDLSYGGLVKAAAGMFFSRNDPDLSRMREAYPGSSPCHLFGRFVNADNLSPDAVKGMFARIGRCCPEKVLNRSYGIMRSGYGFGSDSYTFGLDSITVDRGDAGMRSVTVAEIIDENNILCDCRIYRGANTVRSMMSDLAVYAEPEDTVVYCRSSVLSEEDLEAISGSGFPLVAKCPDGHYDAELTARAEIAAGAAPTSSTTSWDFFERYVPSGRKRFLAARPSTREEKLKVVTGMVNNETKLLRRMHAGVLRGGVPSADYLRRIHPSVSAEGSADYDRAGDPLVLVSTVRPYEYDMGMTPLTLLTRYYNRCSKRLALDRLGHSRVIAEGFEGCTDTDAGIVFVSSMSMLLAGVIEKRLHDYKLPKRINGLVSDFRRCRTEYDGETRSARMYTGSGLFSSFNEYFGILGLDIGLMFR